jgi:hypothetical protein
MRTKSENQPHALRHAPGEALQSENRSASRASHQRWQTVDAECTVASHRERRGVTGTLSGMVDTRLGLRRQSLAGSRCNCWPGRICELNHMPRPEKRIP